MYAIQELMRLLDWVAHGPCQATVQSSKAEREKCFNCKGKEQVTLALMNTKESCSYASMSMPNTGCFCSKISLLSLTMRLSLPSLYLLHAILHFRLSSSLTSTKSEICKALSQSPYWLSTAQWQNLSTFVSGQLLVPLPPAAVCDVFPVFSNAS